MGGGHPLDRERAASSSIIEAAIFLLADPVAREGLAAADPDQEAQRADVAVERAQEHLLVIAHQEADSAPLRG